jgi:hypothetical protein
MLERESHVRGLKLIGAALLAAVLCVGAVVASYAGFAHAASFEIRRRHLSPETHNAIKHAYTSAEIYALIRPLLGADLSGRLVVMMGEGNERMEKYVKHSTDWSRESYKDMRNNLTGMVAAEWLYQTAGWQWPNTRLRLIGQLAQDRVLVPTQDDPRLGDFPDTRDPAPAIVRMRADHDALARALAEDLAAHSAQLRRALGLPRE